jgi:hypothetical protein
MTKITPLRSPLRCWIFAVTLWMTFFPVFLRGQSDGVLVLDRHLFRQELPKGSKLLADPTFSLCFDSIRANPAYPFQPVESSVVNFPDGAVGRIFVGGSNDLMEKLMDGVERGTTFHNGAELIVAFKDNRPAAFDKLSMLVVETSGFNTNEFELFAGNDSPVGKFESLGKFKTQNMLLTQNRYQEFTFPKVTAKYFKYKILNAHGGGTYLPNGMEIQLWGELQ